MSAVRHLTPLDRFLVEAQRALETTLGDPPAARPYPASAEDPVLPAAARRLDAALALAPRARDYCIFSHGSAEPGHKLVLEALGVSPLLDLGLRLGEGTGAALAMFLLRCAANMFNDMATFSQAGVSGPEHN